MGMWWVRSRPNLGRGKRADFAFFKCPPGGHFAARHTNPLGDASASEMHRADFAFFINEYLMNKFIDQMSNITCNFVLGTWQARGHPNLGRGKRADFAFFKCPPGGHFAARHTNPLGDASASEMHHRAAILNWRRGRMCPFSGQPP
jgi:hypothetical protein